MRRNDLNTGDMYRASGAAKAALAAVVAAGDAVDAYGGRGRQDGTPYVLHGLRELLGMCQDRPDCAAVRGYVHAACEALDAGILRTDDQRAHAGRLAVERLTALAVVQA